MKCRHCGIEIAERALICYKCGSATTEAKFQPAILRERPNYLRPALLVPILVGAALALAAAYAMLH